MDNQPTPNNTQQPIAPQPLTPPASVSPGSTAPTTPSPLQPNIPNPPITQPVGAQKKSHKGLIIGIICMVLLLFGVGAVAAIIIMKTQPANMVATSINNLLSAKHISIDGQINVSSKQLPAANSINITFNSIRSDSNYSTTATAQINLPTLGLSVPLTLELSDVIMDNGTIYFKVKGVQDALSVENISAITDTLGSAPDESIMQLAQNVATMLEDRWIEVSYRDILVSYSSTDTDQYIAQYDCANSILHNISQYSGELSNIYSNSPFLVLEKQDDSFYDISLDANQASNFINAIPRTTLASDLAACYDVNLNTTQISPISASNLDELTKALPTISAKFDGFLDYHLAELKISSPKQLDEYITINSDLKFSYDATTTVSAPSDTTSIMDIIQAITMNISELQQDNIQDNCSPDTNCTAGTQDYNFDFNLLKAMPTSQNFTL